MTSFKWGKRAKKGAAASVISDLFCSARDIYTTEGGGEGRHTLRLKYGGDFFHGVKYPNGGSNWVEGSVQEKGPSLNREEEKRHHASQPAII